MKTLKRLLFFTAGVCLLIACSKSDQFLGDDSFGNSRNNGQNEPLAIFKYKQGDVLTFSGKTLYKYVQVIGNNVLADQFCPCEVIATFLEDQKIELFITESGGCGGRSFYAYGKITPSGSTNFEYAVPVIYGMNITDVIQMHLGCIIHGPGINKGTLLFTGKFDGSTLLATSHFTAECDVEWKNNNIFVTPVNGPVQCTWTYDLKFNE